MFLSISPATDPDNMSDVNDVSAQPMRARTGADAC